TIRLVLRGYGDPESIKTEGAQSQDMLLKLRSGRTVPPPAAERKSTSQGARRTVEAPAPPLVVAPPVPAPVVEAPKPKLPDSLTVQIFKGDKQEQRKFQKPDSTKKPDPAK